MLTMPPKSENKVWSVAEWYFSIPLAPWYMAEKIISFSLVMLLVVRFGCAIKHLAPTGVSISHIVSRYSGYGCVTKHPDFSLRYVLKASFTLHTMSCLRRNLAMWGLPNDWLELIFYTSIWANWKNSCWSRFQPLNSFKLLKYLTILLVLLIWRLISC